jgi:hypothetical protein
MTRIDGFGEPGSTISVPGALPGRDLREKGEVWILLLFVFRDIAASSCC